VQVDLDVVGEKTRFPAKMVAGCSRTTGAAPPPAPAPPTATISRLLVVEGESRSKPARIWRIHTRTFSSGSKSLRRRLSVPFVSSCRQRTAYAVERQLLVLELRGKRSKLLGNGSNPCSERASGHGVSRFRADSASVRRLSIDAMCSARRRISGIA
jgi:hypothetical protein